MKIAITYDINSTLIEQHFGESRFFLIAEDKYGQVKTQVINNGGNSHKDLIPYLKGLGVDVLICGGIGNHAVELLYDNGIKVLPGCSGKADHALSQYLEGKLRGNLAAIHECKEH